MLNLRSVQELSKRKRVLSISRPAEVRKPLRGRGFGWWRDPESNRGHKDFQSSALPTELSRRNPKKTKMQIFAQGSIGNLRPVSRMELPWRSNRVFVRVRRRGHGGANLWFSSTRLAPFLCETRGNYTQMAIGGGLTSDYAMRLHGGGHKAQGGANDKLSILHAAFARTLPV